MAEQTTITKSGLVALQKELEEKLLKRDELKATIEEMRDRGDLSENDGYTLALEDNESNERRVAELESLIQNAEVVEDPDNHSVSIGNSVDVESNGQKTSYKVVGEAEADPLKGMISSESPIGSALMGQKVGAIVVVDLPRGKTEYKIVNIS